MLLTEKDGRLFFKLHRALMFFVNQQLQIEPSIRSLDEFANLAPELGVKLRDAWLKEPDLTDAFVAQNPARMRADELEIVRSWQHRVAGDFYIFRYLKNYTVFLSHDDPPIAYGVLALAQPFEHLIGPYLPIWTNAVLLPFKEHIVYDGLLNSYNISFGLGIRRSMNDSFKEAKERQGIITRLPFSAQPPQKTVAKPPPKPRKKRPT